MIDDEESVTMIEFPQMIYFSHRIEKMYFDQYVDCIFNSFENRFGSSAVRGKTSQKNQI